MNLGNNDFAKRFEALKAENEALKLENLQLSSKVREFKNWTSIREGELIPRLNKRYGHIGPCGSIITEYISKIVRELLDINRLAEVNETNYESAKEISIALIETVCKFDWPKLYELQKTWKKHHIN